RVVARGGVTKQARGIHLPILTNADIRLNSTGWRLYLEHPIVWLAYHYATSSMTASPPHPPREASKQLLPWLVAVAFFMESLDTTILNTAVPTIARALHVALLTMVRTFAKSELIRAMSFVAIPGLVGPMLGPLAGGLITGYFHWSVIFFVNIPIGLTGLYLVYRHLPDYREERTPPLDYIGLILFSSGIAILSYVLEVFGEHRLNTPEILGLLALSVLLLAAYGVHATHTANPLLRLTLFRLRTFRAAVSGSFFTRVSIGGIPFLFPL